MGLSIKKRGWFPSQKFQGTDQHAGLQGPRPYTPAACTAPTVTNPVSCLGRVSPCMMYRYLGYKVLRVPSGSKTAAQTVGVIFFCSLLCWALELGEEMEYGSTSLYPQVEHTPCLWLALGDVACWNWGSATPRCEGFQSSRLGANSTLVSLLQRL